MSQRESPLLADVKLAIGSRQDCFVIRVNTGVYRPLHDEPRRPKRAIRSAPNGTPDLLVWQRVKIPTLNTVNPDGFQPHEKKYDLYVARGVAIETKSAKGRQREDQKHWQAAFESVRGVYILAKTVQDVLDILGPEPK